MIIDKRIEFADDLDFNNETGTANVGDQIPLGVTGQNIAVNPLMYLVVTVDTSADGGAGNAATVAFQLASDATATIAVDGSQTVHFTSTAYGKAALTEGTVFVFPVPFQDYEPYVGLQIVTAVEGEDALKCSAFLTTNPPTLNKYYADGDN